MLVKSGSQLVELLTDETFEHGFDVLRATFGDTVERGWLTPEPVLNLTCVVLSNGRCASGPRFVEQLFCRAG